MNSTIPNHTRLCTDADSRRYEDWLFIQQEAKKRPAKVGARLTGNSVVAFANIRAGRNKPSFDALMEWARNDKAFAVALAVQIGVILPGGAEEQQAMLRKMGGGE